MDKRHKDKITIITPSHNQAAYIEQTIESVLAQDYPDVEHVVVDGGSTDGTIDILKRYNHLIWIAEKDRGQADALNKGLALATGDIIGWINSDDYYEKDVFGDVVSHFSDSSTAWIVGNLCKVRDGDGTVIPHKSPKVTLERLIRDPDIVRQQCTFFRRSALDRAGGWNAEFFMVMDLDLWFRLSRISPPKMVDQNLAYFRVHANQKTGLSNLQRQTREICRVLRREHAPWHAIARLYFKKQWQALMGCCRMLLVLLGVLDAVKRCDLAKRSAR
ncbi:MAG: glycosyltransferase family 2 protein [Syntrophorhabdales bacterium]|jgi:glycosyltransferase involved in cell wall biosynthesis